MFKVVSKYANTDIVFANSHGPYAVNGGSPIMMTAGAGDPNASYAWDFGDGSAGAGSTIQHTYGKDGVYFAKVTVTVNQPGGDTSVHWALIRVRNVPPIVDAGPSITVNEGDVVQLKGGFTDVQWLETHQATWDWGDSQKTDPGVVAETHNPPLGIGTVTGTHAWGDAGVYPVTLSVQDKGGAIGRGRTTVTVLNVPPTVDAGPPMYAYPCCVLTLTGEFTDPGWLDSHAGFWDFGDCSGPLRAVVREKHDPPKGEGVAILSHVYSKCGVYSAKCIVIDDDGGVGESSTVIRVVDIRNAGFEHGFCVHHWGLVGNEWRPYAAAVPNPFGQQTAPIERADLFDAAEFPVHSGERSQRIHFTGKSRAGILQRIGANPGWDYQVSIWYSLNEQAGGTSQLLKDVDDIDDIVPPDATGGFARLGIDPTGGTDPSSANVIWIEGYLRPEWAQLAVRATASKNAVTIFAEGQGMGKLGLDVFFDDAAIEAVQPFCPVAPPKRQDVCVNFSDVKPGTTLPAVFSKDTFTFSAVDKQTQQVVAIPAPVEQNALVTRLAGLVIDLPFVADAVSVVLGPTTAGTSVRCLGTTNNVIDQTTAAPSSQPQTIELSGPGIVRVVINPRERGELIQICAHPAAQIQKPVGADGNGR